MQRRPPFVLVALLGGALVGAAACAPDAPGRCGDDDDCDDGRACVDEACVTRADPTVRILALTAAPSTVAPGGEVLLSWETRNASECTLAPGAGVVPRVGVFRTAVSTTTVFELTCQGAGGPAVASATVRVQHEDAGVSDGGGDDAGALDAGDGGGPTLDAGDGGADDAGAPPDGGTPPLDAGFDAGGLDPGSPDGGTADGGPAVALPVSCSDLRVRHAVSVDGVYTVDPDGPGGQAPFDVWCDMTTEGGGWALVLKVDGSKTTFRYAADAWTDDTLLRPDSLSPVAQEAKLPGYLALPVDRVRVTLRDDEHGTRSLTLALSAPSLRDLIDDGRTATDEGPEAWGALADGDPLPDACLVEGVNVSAGGLVIFSPTDVRIGAMGDDAFTCSDPSSYVGVGFSSSLNCAPPTAGFVDDCTTGSSGDPAFALVWVRDEDFTDLPPAASCEDHLEAGRTVSGLYTLAGQGDPVAAYCDMTTDGGGWTLVGASVKGTSAQAFGWRSQTGTVRDDDAPYSLGALARGLPFEEALVGRRGSGKQLRSNAYRVQLPDGFFTEAGKTTAYPTGAPEAVLGDCAPGEYGMFRHWGHTALTTRFHIRDLQFPTGEGLTPGGLDLHYEGCEEGGFLHETQGLLFVR